MKTKKKAQAYTYFYADAKLKKEVAEGLKRNGQTLSWFFRECLVQKLKELREAG